MIVSFYRFQPQPALCRIITTWELLSQELTSLEPMSMLLIIFLLLALSLLLLITFLLLSLSLTTFLFILLLSLLLQKSDKGQIFY